MNLKITIKNKEDANKFILVSAIGLLESLEKKLLTINECQQYLFSPYSVSILEKERLDEKVIKIVELGCELEDIESLLPNELNTEIKNLKEQAKNALKKINSNPDFSEDRKWLDQ
ncbi:hypothetical protein D920_00312 [Enterococcus faecalis 13-SD-W-01]|nr:hypothetical protein D920_00312 [Enterococcus faecalis 13-SD-W-01]